jgi:hypothetical protein
MADDPRTPPDPQPTTEGGDKEVSTDVGPAAAPDPGGMAGEGDPEHDRPGGMGGEG